MNSENILILLELLKQLKDKLIKENRFEYWRMLFNNLEQLVNIEYLEKCREESLKDGKDEC